MNILEMRQENKPSANQKHKSYSERYDLITPAWRRFWNEHCWPAWRLDRVSLDELLRLQKAVSYLQRAIDDAVDRKLRAAS